MATIQTIYAFLRHHALGSLSQQALLSDAVAELVSYAREDATSVILTSNPLLSKGFQVKRGSDTSDVRHSKSSLHRVESQVSTEVPDERTPFVDEDLPPVVASLTCLPEKCKMKQLYNEALAHQPHQYECRLGGLDCVVYTNTLLDEAQLVVVFLHGLGASPWHFLKIGVMFHTYLGGQILKKGKFFQCKAAFIFPFGPIAMSENEFGAVDGTVYGSYKWWDIFNADGITSSGEPVHDAKLLSPRTPRGTATVAGKPLRKSCLTKSESEMFFSQRTSGVEQNGDDDGDCNSTSSFATVSVNREPITTCSPGSVPTPAFHRPFCWCLKPDCIESGRVTDLGFPWGNQEVTTPLNQPKALISQSAAAMSLDNPVGRPKATRAVRSLIEHLETRWNIPTSKLVLGGFSQGAMLALDVLFYLPSPPALLTLMSGAPMCVELWKQRLLAMPLTERRALKSVPVLQAHGNKDWVFPVFVGRWLNRFLKRNGFWTKFIEFEGEHELSDQALEVFYGLCFQLAVERSTPTDSSVSTLPESPAASVASPSNQLPGFSRILEQQPLMDTFDDILYKAGYAVASCVLPVAKKIG
eukprot:Gregarina_sp_Poly_1__11339@NODE_952_length_5572_cov_61_818892_g676_i0_p1_GENE_NODE_952_length_5572_cov_61_818892_g676_i0NODE_952_length_5572_cov_61_818892_g676_i0_p1_ORF_typecomplete_len583_score78_65Abhydrolase_2/PF02230_16/0_039Abhydrolase_2/PF02230_16/6_9e23Hydrolase_4/PF12146_8/1_5e02Hydrolase_4/PF12146_8/5_7e06Peptidase_S9/PF00326_21/1_6e06Abhydrolase_3/PF07859_13/3e06DLH/PF01738_18/3_9e06FSH1/PF03959_13/7_4e02FSH1/PF03959_13/1_7e05Esterase_phd/PF10503_9/1_7e02Esterase_phd/PF10503_9/0_00042